MNRRISWKFIIHSPIFTLFLEFFLLYNAYKNDENIVTARESQIDEYNAQIELWLQRDKGRGCVMPKTDPFAEEILCLLNASVSKITCPGVDWVTCEGSQCYVKEIIVTALPYVECYYRDLIYVNDNNYSISSPAKRVGREIYELGRSDHVKIFCTEGGPSSFLLYYFQSQKWSGIKTGLRPIQVKSPSGREDSPNVLILLFDSVSHNQFLRRLPLAYKVLTNELNAVVLNSYNIIGDATPAAMFPILTGKTEFELPDARIVKKNSYLDPEDFLFKKLEEDGYRTAYFEDQSHLGTFQLRYNGFKSQPSHHYLRSFMMENHKKISKRRKEKSWDYMPYCVGATPTYILLLNITRQFTTLKGKLFGLTIISDLSHYIMDDYNRNHDLGSGEDELISLLRYFKSSGFLENTLLLVMSDHGSRYSKLRHTYQGKLEERLPFVSITLPEKLKIMRPNAERNLKMNANTLTTPFDIHTTILDVIGLNHLRNDFKVPGTDLPRGMSLIEPIPLSRSCSEAYVDVHWCACLNWEEVNPNDAMFSRVGRELAVFINSLIDNAKCAPRRLLSIEWVKREIGTFDHSVQYKKMPWKFFKIPYVPPYVFYQAQIAMTPGKALYEGTVTFFEHTRKFVVFERDISRVNAYGNESKCVVDTHPHLRKYCYCKSEHTDC